VNIGTKGLLVLDDVGQEYLKIDPATRLLSSDSAQLEASQGVDLIVKGIQLFQALTDYVTTWGILRSELAKGLGYIMEHALEVLAAKALHGRKGSVLSDIGANPLHPVL
jgi:hypothetical protein